MFLDNGWLFCFLVLTKFHCNFFNRQLSAASYDVYGQANWSEFEFEFMIQCEFARNELKTVKINYCDQHVLRCTVLNELKLM